MLRYAVYSVESEIAPEHTYCYSLLNASQILMTVKTLVPTIVTRMLCAQTNTAKDSIATAARVLKEMDSFVHVREVVVSTSTQIY